MSVVFPRNVPEQPRTGKLGTDGKFPHHVADRVVTITLNRPDKLNGGWPHLNSEKRFFVAGAAPYGSQVRVLTFFQPGAPGRGWAMGRKRKLQVEKRNLGHPAWEGMDELSRFRGLAYRVDARDHFIVF